MSHELQWFGGGMHIQPWEVSVPRSKRYHTILSGFTEDEWSLKQAAWVWAHYRCRCTMERQNQVIFVCTTLLLITDTLELTFQFPNLSPPPVCAKGDRHLVPELLHGHRILSGLTHSSPSVVAIWRYHTWKDLLWYGFSVTLQYNVLGTYLPILLDDGCWREPTGIDTSLHLPLSFQISFHSSCCYSR